MGAADQLGWEVIGFKDGFEDCCHLATTGCSNRRTPSGSLKLGGTILGTTNKGNFAAKIGKGNVSEVPQEIIAKAKRTLDQLETAR